MIPRFRSVSACSACTLRASSSMADTPTSEIAARMRRLALDLQKEKTPPLRPVTTSPEGRPGSELNTARAAAPRLDHRAALGRADLLVAREEPRGPGAAEARKRRGRTCSSPARPSCRRRPARKPARLDPEGPALRSPLREHLVAVAHQHDAAPALPPAGGAPSSHARLQAIAVGRARAPFPRGCRALQGSAAPARPPRPRRPCRRCRRPYPPSRAARRASRPPANRATRRSRLRRRVARAYSTPYSTFPMRCTARTRRALSSRKKRSKASPSRWSTGLPAASSARRSSGSATAWRSAARSRSWTGRRRPRRGEDAGPDVELDVAVAPLDEGRHLLEAGRAPGTPLGERAQPPLADVRQRRSGAGGERLHLPAEQRGQRRAAALEGRVQQVDVRGPGQHRHRARAAWSSCRPRSRRSPRAGASRPPRTPRASARASPPAPPARWGRR